MDSLKYSERYLLQSSEFRKIGYAFWFVMGIISILFFKERAAFMDGAFQLVDLINTGEFSIHHNRLTNPITQILAWISVKLSLPLKYVMIGYSLNFILFHLFIYHLIIKWCKNDLLGLVQIGFFSIFVTQSFYFLPPEFFQGMSLLILWCAVLIQPTFQNKWWRLPLLIFLLILIIFDHALLSVFFLLVWIFFWFQNKEIRTIQYYTLLGLIVLVYIIHEHYFLGWYDVARKEHFWRHWNQFYPHFERIPGHKVFLQRCVDTYYFFPILLAIVTVGYLKAHFNRSVNISAPILKLGLILGFCFCYLLLNHINDPNTPFLFYSEVNYMGLAIPLLLPLCFDFLPEWSAKRYTIVVISCILMIRVITIVTSSGQLRERHSWMISQMGNSDSNKIYVNSNKVLKDLLIQTWAVPEESMLISSLNDTIGTSTILIKRSDYKYNSDIDSNNVFLRSYSVQSIAELNTHYFNLGSNQYEKIDLPFEY